jgi:hypothetical protein
MNRIRGKENTLFKSDNTDSSSLFSPWRANLNNNLSATESLQQPNNGVKFTPKNRIIFKSNSLVAVLYFFYRFLPGTAFVFQFSETQKVIALTRDVPFVGHYSSNTDFGEFAQKQESTCCFHAVQPFYHRLSKLKVPN